MKRIIGILMVFVSILSSCSSYTCATYAKIDSTKDVRSAKYASHKQSEVKN